MMKSLTTMKLIISILVFSHLRISFAAQRPSMDEKKQRLIQLIGNSVAMNLSSKVKTNGVASSVSLPPWAVNEVFFEMHENRSSLAIFIDLMCFASLQWTVSYLDYSDIMQNKWKRVEIDMPRDKKGPKTFLHVKNFASNNVAVALAVYETKHSQLFTLHEAPKGFYKIAMQSTTSLTQVVGVSVLVGGSLELGMPQLPPDKKLSVAHFANGYVNLYWEPAKMMERDSKNTIANIDYCVSVNTRRNFDRLCQAQDLMKKNPSDMIIFFCVRGQNQFNPRKHLSSDVNYHVNVFAVNPHSNRSRAYAGLTLPKHRSSLTSRLRQDSTLNLKIDPKTGYRVVQFEVARQGTIRLTVIACEGPVTVAITNESRVLKKYQVYGVKTNTIKAATVGTYFVTLNKKIDGELNLRIHLSSSKRWGPFPRLPKGKGVKEWPMLRTCTSVTIAWLAAKGKQQFCLYIGRYSTKIYKKLGNVCFKPMSDSGVRRIICIHKRIRKNHKAIFTRTIKGLRPCTSYVLYIQVKRRRSTDTLIYRPLTLRTRCKRCIIDA